MIDASWLLFCWLSVHMPYIADSTQTTDDIRIETWQSIDKYFNVLT
jgi:hypothetical protein